MHDWKTSTLIFAVMLGGMAITAVAEDMPLAPTQAAPAQQAPVQIDPVTGQPVPPVFPTITMPGAPGAPVAPVAAAPNAPAQSDAMAIEDEEAPAADAPLADPFGTPEPQAVGGPKTATDKIVEKFMLLDTDESKSVSMQEYLVMVQQRVQARFEAMDANHNGEISEDEYRTFWKTRMTKWYSLQR